MNKIAIIEDDIDICNMIAKFLENNKYIVHYALNGAEGIELCKSLVPDLIILDIMLPKLNGNDVLQRLRKFTNAPVIVVSAKTMVQTKIDLLKLGADDYIVKPFDSEVLILKIKAILSRSKHEEAEPKPKFITIGEYVFNTELRTITKNEEQIKLTPKEARLLELLYNYKDGLLPREKALTEIWGTNDYFTARSMDVYVTKLRKYFKDDQNIKIENVHGSGFRLVIEE